MGWFFTLLIAGNGPHCEEISIILSTNPSGIKPSSPRVWLNQCPPVSPRKAQVLSGCCVLSTRGFKTRHHGECNEGIWSDGVIYIEDISRRSIKFDRGSQSLYVYAYKCVYIYMIWYVYVYIIYIYYPVSGVSIGHWIVHTPEVQSRQSLDVGLTDHHFFKVVCNRENHSSHFEHG